MKTIELNNGQKMPALGLGTWKSKPGQVKDAVLEALKVGYRHLDCAWIYGNEKEIGEALKTAFSDGLVTREELWVTSKLWNDSHRPEDVLTALKDTLGKLQLDHLDLYLMHWPVAHKPGIVLPKKGADMVALDDLPLSRTWSAMEELVKDGVCTGIGVSNFSLKKLSALYDAAAIKPVANQVESHPYLQQKELCAWCAEHGISYTAYSPLGSGASSAKGKDAVLENAAIVEIAEQVSATPAQVLLAWALGRGTVAIPKSTNAGRIAENFKSLEVELSEEQMKRISDLDQHARYVDGQFWAKEGGPYTLSNLWDE